MLAKLSRQALAPFDIGPVETAILMYCSRNHASTTERLAGAIHLDPASISRHLAKLVGKGLVRRTRPCRRPARRAFGVDGRGMGLHAPTHRVPPRPQRSGQPRDWRRREKGLSGRYTKDTREPAGGTAENSSKQLRGRSSAKPENVRLRRFPRQPPAAVPTGCLGVRRSLNRLGQSQRP